MTQSLKSLFTALVFMLAVGVALGDQSLVQLQAFPTISVADGRSTVDISAAVRDTSGHLAPNGTQVVFSTTLGNFRDNVVSTVNGIAHAVLVAGSIPGTANITAVSSLGGTPSVLNFEFVETRAELSSAREYVEIDAPSSLQYDHVDRIISAGAPHHGVSLRYRDIQIDADDLEYDINTYIVKARRARMKMGHSTEEFDELRVMLNAHLGYGTTTYKRPAPSAFAQQGMGMVFLDQKADGSYEVAQPQDMYGMVEVHRDGVKPFMSKLPADEFKFTDLSAAPSMVAAKRATVYPKKQIQFQRAEIYVANAKIIHLPLFVVDFANTTGPMVTDGLLSVTDNQIGINYPQYLMLKPGLSSDLRFHMGDAVGRDSGSDRGAFLDYELNWDRGDDMQGGLTFSGIGRDDWIASLNQYWRLDERSTASTEFSVPAGQGFFGSGSISHQFNGYSTDLNANHSQTFTGIQSTSQSYSTDLTTDPRRISKSPVRYSYGFTAVQTSSDDQVLGNREQDGMGLEARAMTDNISLSKISTLTASATATKLYGHNELAGVGLLGVVNVSHKIGKDLSILTTYNYTLDGFNDAETGHHLLSMEGDYRAGKLELNMLGSKSLDIDRFNLYTDLSYHVSNLWRLGYSYTDSRILDTEFLDWNLSLNYRIGWREMGILWSERTHRFGFQLLGATF
jgi:hypothetical protein